MCNKAVDNYAHALKFVPDQCKAQKMCIKAVDTHPSTRPDFRVSTAIMLSRKIFTIGGASWTLDPCTQVYFSQPSFLQQFHMKYKRTNYHVEIWISKFITPCWNWIWQSWFVVIMLNISSTPEKLYLVEHSVQKSDDSKYCNFFNSKLCHWYISASFTKFSEQTCL